MNLKLEGSRVGCNKKSISLIGFGFVLSFVLFASARVSSSMAKMQALEQMPINKLIASLTSKQKHKTLSDEELNLLFLSQIAKEVLGIDQVWAVSSSKTLGPEAGVSAYVVINEMHEKIRSGSLWDSKLSTQGQDLLKEKREVLKKALAFEPYVLAWVEFQVGDETGSKSILKRAFEKEFQEVMRLERIETDLSGGGPMGNAEDLGNAISKFQSKLERSETEGKVKKMKVHISKLPEEQIKT